MSKKTKIILFAILLLAFILRIYKFQSYYNFSHDQDLASWIIKDILFNKHFRLIGQETSSQGVFIGGLFYYLQIPFYLFGKMNPLSSIFLTVILGVFATYSVFFVVGKIFKSKIGLIASFIYAASALVVFTDREVVPTMPVMLWSVWYLYSLFLVYKGQQLKGFVLWGLLIGLVWHLNLALLVLSPLVFVAFIFSKKRIDLKALTLGILVLILVSLPLIMFEVRHNFGQTKSIILSLTSNKDYIEGTALGFGKLDRVMQLLNKNSIKLFSPYVFIRPSVIFWSLAFLLIYLIKRKKINLFFGVTFILWELLYIVFFSFNSLNVSEYYFNGINIIWIITFSFGLYEIDKNFKFGKFIVVLLLTLFLVVNVLSLYSYNTDKKGYIEKTSLIAEIKSDSQKHNYPCISISYITKGGYDFGYRYLFWLAGMHVNRPNSGSPVYSIVFPHSMVNKIDRGFGSLGLIYPDYGRYNKTDVEKSCQGANSNLTDPMFGYVE